MNLACIALCVAITAAIASLILVAKHSFDETRAVERRFRAMLEQQQRVDDLRRRQDARRHEERYGHVDEPGAIAPEDMIISTVQQPADRVALQVGRELEEDAARIRGVRADTVVVDEMASFTQETLDEGIRVMAERERPIEPVHSVIVGGRDNHASGEYSFIGGGYNNTVGGGYSNNGGGSYGCGAFEMVEGSEPVIRITEPRQYRQVRMPGWTPAQPVDVVSQDSLSYQPARQNTEVVVTTSGAIRRQHRKIRC